jgi:TRAP transporter TAXI family solute receptor
MRRENLNSISRRDLLRAMVLAAALIAAALWVSFSLLEPAPPRRIVLASGVEGGLYHRYAQRYRAILARDGVTVDERMTNGAGDNLRLLLDPDSGVDVAFMQGGVPTFPAADQLVMLASLYYEPLWVFYRGADTRTQLNALLGKRLAIGLPGSGTRALVEPLLAANGMTPDNTAMLPLGTGDALRALRAGEVDAAIMVGGTQTDAIVNALRDPSLKLLSFARADAYQRRYPYITKLTLPPGTIDFALDIPDREVRLLGTKSMLAARDGLHPALVNLLTDAAREIHGEQGYFEAAGEFPNTAHVDLRVSPDADRHHRFGPSLLYRYLPFWVATFVERAIIVVVPLLVVLVPLVRLLPQFLRWRVRSRIYRWYGELVLLERDVATRRGTLPIEKWLRDLDRIERAAEQIQTPTSFASEAYTLREHIGLVRRKVQARAADDPGATMPSSPAGE